MEGWLVVGTLNLPRELKERNKQMYGVSIIAWNSRIEISLDFKRISFSI